MVTSRIWFTARRRPSCGSDGRTGRVLRPSRGRWKGRTRPALSGSWYSMEGSAGAAPESAGSAKA